MMCISDQAGRSVLLAPVALLGAGNQAERRKSVELRLRRQVPGESATHHLAQYRVQVLHGHQTTLVRVGPEGVLGTHAGGELGATWRVGQVAGDLAAVAVVVVVAVSQHAVWEVPVHPVADGLEEETLGGRETTWIPGHVHEVVRRVHLDTAGSEVPCRQHAVQQEAAERFDELGALHATVALVVPGEAHEADDHVVGRLVAGDEEIATLGLQRSVARGVAGDPAHAHALGVDTHGGQYASRGACIVDSARRVDAAVAVPLVAHAAEELLPIAAVHQHKVAGICPHVPEVLQDALRPIGR